MSEQFPDYAKSTHPEVLEAIRETKRRRKEFMDKLCAVSEKYTGKPDAAYYNGWVYANLQMTGISRRAVPDMSKLPGQWKKPDRDVLAPYKNNTVAMADFDVRMKSPDIPGRENLVMGHGRMGTGQLFEFDGAAYSHFGFERFPMNEREATAASEFGWTEILASEYHKAKEGYEAEFEAKKAAA